VGVSRGHYGVGRHYRVRGPATRRRGVHIAAGAAVTAGEPCGEVESVKSVSDLYSPVDGEIAEVNGELEDDPSLVNAEPYTAGWMFRVRVAQDGNGDAALPPDLLSAAEYEELTKSAG
jgi:glycine cleavage system H protein